MDVFQSVILGVVQGVTEFIPVSSSGHLAIISNLFNASSNVHLFIQVLDIGTILALLLFFRRRLLDLVRQVFLNHDYRLLRNLFITCLPVAIIGLLLVKIIENSPFFTSSLVIVTTMLLLGIVMVALEKLPRLSKVNGGAGLSPGRALIIGLAQCTALVPGVSRSGSTIVAARLMGMDNRQAAEYSFMVCIPIMIGLVGKLVISDYGFIVANWQPVLIGNVAAFIAGIIAIRYFLNYLSKHDLKVFGIYRITLAIIVLLLLAGGILSH